MISVKILEFGSNWWARFGQRATDPWRFSSHASYYNSTGVRCGSKMRRHWLVPGLIRFNGTGDFDPHFPFRSIGQTFSCFPVVETSYGSRLFMERRAHTDRVDYFLAVIANDRHGNIDFSMPGHKSASVLPIAASELRDVQEVLVLMRSGDWVRSSVGIWKLVVGEGFPHDASLKLQEAVVVC